MTTTFNLQFETITTIAKGDLYCQACNAYFKETATTIARHVQSKKHPFNRDHYKNRGTLFKSHPISQQLNFDLALVMGTNNIKPNALSNLHHFLIKWLPNNVSSMLRTDMSSTLKQAWELIKADLLESMKDQWFILEWDESGDTERGISLLGADISTAFDSALVQLKAVEGFGDNGGLENEEVARFLNSVFLQNPTLLRERLILPKADGCAVNGKAWDTMAGVFPNCSPRVRCTQHLLNRLLENDAGRATCVPRQRTRSIQKLLLTTTG